MGNSIKKFFWKVWTVLNHLTRDDDKDSYAEVSTINDTAYNADLARAMVEGRSEFNYETILSIIEQRDAMVLKFILNGRSFIDNNVQMTPRVKGVWRGLKPTPNYDIHRASVDLVATSKFRKALEQVGFEVLGPKDNTAIISLVTDTLTDATNGTVTPNEDIRIVGDKIKIVPKFDGYLGDEGIFFVDDSGTRHQVTRKLTENNPSSILARVPALIPGEYTLEIVSYFSGNNAKPLTTARILRYAFPIIVE